MKKTIITVFSLVAFVAAMGINFSLSVKGDGSKSVSVDKATLQALACGGGGSEQEATENANDSNWLEDAIDWISDTAHEISDSLQLSGVSETTGPPENRVTDPCNGSPELCTGSGSAFAALGALGGVIAGWNAIFH